MMGRTHTRIGNLNFDHAALKGLPIKGQGLFQAVKVAELDIAKALGALQFAILDNSDADNVAAVKEVGHRFVGGII